MNDEEENITNEVRDRVMNERKDYTVNQRCSFYEQKKMRKWKRILIKLIMVTRVLKKQIMNE